MKGARNPKEEDERCEQSFSTRVEARSQLISTKEDSVATLETSATADLVSFSAAESS